MRDSSVISRSFVVSFFTHRHPQTKTNITDRNDGLIDGTKSRSRSDFEELKDFISTNRFFFFTATGSPERLPRQLQNLILQKFGSEKHAYSLTLKFDVKLPRLLTWPLSYPFLLHWNVLEVSTAISEIVNIFSHQVFCFSECSYRRWRKFVQEKTVYLFIFLISAFGDRL